MRGRAWRCHDNNIYKFTQTAVQITVGNSILFLLPTSILPSTPGAVVGQKKTSDSGYRLPPGAGTMKAFFLYAPTYFYSNRYQTILMLEEHFIPGSSTFFTSFKKSLLWVLQSKPTHSLHTPLCCSGRDNPLMETTSWTLIFGSCRERTRKMRG